MQESRGVLGGTGNKNKREKESPRESLVDDGDKTPPSARRKIPQKHQQPRSRGSSFDFLGLSPPPLLLLLDPSRLTPLESSINSSLVPPPFCSKGEETKRARERNRKGGRLGEIVETQGERDTGKSRREQGAACGFLRGSFQVKGRVVVVVVSGRILESGPSFSCFRFRCFPPLLVAGEGGLASAPRASLSIGPVRTVALSLVVFSFFFLIFPRYIVSPRSCTGSRPIASFFSIFCFS